MQVVADQRDRSLFQPLHDYISALGVELEIVEPGTVLQPVPTMVVISGSLLSSDQRAYVEDQLRAVTDVLPVNVAGTTDGFLDDLSQLFVDSVGVEETARRVALMARLAGSDLSTWNRLAARATEWAKRSDRSWTAPSSVSRCEAIRSWSDWPRVLCTY